MRDEVRAEVYRPWLEARPSRSVWGGWILMTTWCLWGKLGDCIPGEVPNAWFDCRGIT